MSAEDIQTLLHRNPTLSASEIATALQQLQGIREPVDEEFSIQLMVTPNETRLRQQTQRVGQDIKKSETRDRIGKRSDTTMLRKISPTSKFYPLIHTITGTFLFPKPSSVSDLFYGARVQTNGARISIADKTRLNPTNKITIAIKCKPPISAGEAIILRKDLQYDLRIVNTNKIQFRTYSGGAWRAPIEFTYTPGNKISVVAIYDSANGHKLYIDTTLQASDAVGGALNTTTNALNLFGDGILNLPTTFEWGWLTMLNFEVDSTWVTNFNNGLLDTHNKNEILTIDGIGDANPRPEATFGIAKIT